jgi:hypothetical protein
LPSATLSLSGATGDMISYNTALLSGSPSLTKNDTDGEVIFAGIYPLIKPVFRFVPNVNRAYFRLRHQYQK